MGHKGEEGMRGMWQIIYVGPSQQAGKAIDHLLISLVRGFFFCESVGFLFSAFS